MPKREKGLLRGLGLEQDIRTAMAIAVGGLGPDNGEPGERYRRPEGRYDDPNDR